MPCSEDEAQKELERIAKDGQITGQDIDWTQQDDDGDDGIKNDADTDEEDVEDESSDESADGRTD